MLPKIYFVTKISLLLYLLGFLGILFFQRLIILHPQTFPSNQKYPFDAEEINCLSKDGHRINALLFSCSDSIKKGVVLYLHGNADNLARWGKHAPEFTNRGYDVVFYDYRGFGKSTGRLTQENLLSDAQMLYDYVEKRYPTQQVLLYGRSLGTGVALYLAQRNAPEMLILETPYYSMTDVFQSRLPIYPYSKMLEFKLPSYEWIRGVKCPIHVFHGTNDGVVPYSQSLKLIEAAGKNPAQTLTTLPQGRHKGLDTFPAYETTMDSLLHHRSE